MRLLRFWLFRKSEGFKLEPDDDDVMMMSLMASMIGSSLLPIGGSCKRSIYVFHYMVR